VSSLPERDLTVKKKSRRQGRPDVVVDVLRELGKGDVVEIAKKAGVHFNTVKKRLGQLRAEDRVEIAEYRKTNRGPPAPVYRMTTQKDCKSRSAGDAPKPQTWSERILVALRTLPSQRGTRKEIGMASKCPKGSMHYALKPLVASGRVRKVAPRGRPASQAMYQLVTADEAIPLPELKKPRRSKRQQKRCSVKRPSQDRIVAVLKRLGRASCATIAVETGFHREAVKKPLRALKQRGRVVIAAYRRKLCSVHQIPLYKLVEPGQIEQNAPRPKTLEERIVPALRGLPECCGTAAEIADVIKCSEKSLSTPLNMNIKRGRVRKGTPRAPDGRNGRMPSIYYLTVKRPPEEDLERSSKRRKTSL